MLQPDVIVVGGGIAGVSVGYELAHAGQQVLLVESEATLAYHTTGRSAAQYLENYGSETVRRLTIGSRSFFAEPRDDLTDQRLWSPRPFLRVGREAHAPKLREQAEEAQTLVPSTQYLDGDGARQVFPPLREDVVGALFEPDAMDLDVAAIHQAYVRGLRGAGGEIRTSSPVVGITPSLPGWRVTIGSSGQTTETIDTSVVVDAAGAWGDVLGEMAGARPLGLRPLRRTIAVAALPDSITAADTAGWPLAAFEADDGSMDGYCKPESGGLLVSPGDETLSPPCDARPEEVDVARGIDSLERWTSLHVRHVRSTWAGLRSFTTDRTPVAGFAADAPGFFWLVGQGGYGIHTSPALARAATSVICRDPFPSDLSSIGLTAADLSPERESMSGPPLPAH